MNTAQEEVPVRLAATPAAAEAVPSPLEGSLQAKQSLAASGGAGRRAESPVRPSPVPVAVLTEAHLVAPLGPLTGRPPVEAL